jgi:hypothetical protein
MLRAAIPHQLSANCEVSLSISSVDKMRVDEEPPIR